MTDCDFLPDSILFSDFGGDWPSFIEEVYSEFKKNFIDSKPQYLGKNVDIIHQTIFDGKERSFWHIVSEGNCCDKDRTPDIRRCEKVTHVRPLIEHTDNSCQHYLVWQKFHDKTSKNRIYLWCVLDNLLVVLEDRKSHYKLITAFVVKEYNVAYYKKEYDKYHQ